MFHYRPYIRQSVAQRLVSSYWTANDVNLRGSSVVGCGRWRIFGADPGVAQIELVDGRARMTGHFACNCNWTCECCASATVARNRSWLRGALFPALQRAGKSGSLITLTLAHTYNEDWAVPMNALKSAFALFDRRMSKNYKAAGCVGKFKAVEVTVGANGLHPHMHILLTHDVDADLGALEAAMHGAWLTAVSQVGGRCTDRGFDFKANCLNDYAAKMSAAHEISSQSTKSGRKKGKTLSQLLDHAGRGDLEAGAEWQRAIAAIGNANRFHAGALAKNLDIPTPSEWTDEPDEPAADTAPQDLEIITYPLDDHLAATNPILGRPGLAMILRAARRGGAPSVLKMVRALREESRRLMAALHRHRWEPATGQCASDAAVIARARGRPLPQDTADYVAGCRSRGPLVVA